MGDSIPNVIQIGGVRLSSGFHLLRAVELDALVLQNAHGV